MLATQADAGTRSGNGGEFILYQASFQPADN